VRTQRRVPVIVLGRPRERHSLGTHSHIKHLGCRAPGRVRGDTQTEKSDHAACGADDDLKPCHGVAGLGEEGDGVAVHGEGEGSEAEGEEGGEDGGEGVAVDVDFEARKANLGMLTLKVRSGPAGESVMSSGPAVGNLATQACWTDRTVAVIWAWSMRGISCASSALTWRLERRAPRREEVSPVKSERRSS
jgi:hypothetical protein